MKRIFLFSILCLFVHVSGFGQTKEEDLKNAVEYFRKANQFKMNYKFDEASDYFAKAADLFKKHGKTGNYINCKYSQGDIFMAKNNLNKANNIFNDLENLSKNKYGEKNKFLINIYYGKGIVLFYKGKNDSSLIFFKKSLNLNTEFASEKNLFTANLYSSIGNVYAVNGSYNSALDYYKKDLELRKKLLDEQNPQLAVVYNNLSISYRNMGEYDKALFHIEKAIKLSLSAYGEKNQETANYYSGKGGIFFDQSQNELAMEYFTKSLKIKRSIFGDMSKVVADDYNNIGLVQKEQADYDKALSSFQSAYDIQKAVLGEKHPDISVTCNNIAYILQYQEKYASALFFYNEAVEITKNAFGSTHPELSAYYNNIGNCYSEQKEQNKALENYLKAVEMLEMNYGSKFPGLVKMYVNIADIYVKQKDFDTALKLYQKALISNVKNFSPESNDYIENPELIEYFDINKLLLSLKGKAKVFDLLFVRDSLYEYAENSYKTYLLCDSVINIARKSVVKKKDKIELADKTKIIYEDAIISSMGMAYLTDNEIKKRKFYERAFFFSEKNKAAVLSEAVAASEAKKFAGIPENVLEKEKEFQKQISKLEKKIAETTDDNQLSAYKDILFEINNKYRKLSKEIEKKYPNYYNSKYKSLQVDLQDIQNSLSNSTALRSYFAGKEQIIIFTVTKNKIDVISVKKPADLEIKTTEFITNITSGKKPDFAKYTVTAYDFYKLFFPDIIEKNINNLIIIPDGIIGVIPFEALFNQKFEGDVLNFSKYPFLLYKYKFSFFYSANLFYKSLKSNKKNKYSSQDDWLGIAPVFEDLTERNVHGMYVSELPASKTEISKISEVFSELYFIPTSISGMAANEKHIKSQKLSSYKYIHIATHGTVNTEHPELSALFMYPDGSGTEDNILFSGEIYNLELNAKLVVLSACETGLGKISKSEGIIGLPRSLLYAGAENIIVSLWKVADKSTASLMIDFYRYHLKEKENFTDALYHAKIKMIKKGGNYAHPFFWSPFILIGK